MKFSDHPAWYIQDLLFDLVGACLLALIGNFVFLLILVLLQFTQGLPPWAWGGFAGWFIGQVVGERKALLAHNGYCSVWNMNAKA